MGAAFAYVPTLAAVAGMGGTGAEDFGSARNWLVATVTLVACVAFANFGKIGRAHV